jgi:hypothetical protein
MTDNVIVEQYYTAAFGDQETPFSGWPPAG